MSPTVCVYVTPSKFTQLKQSQNCVTPGAPEGRKKKKKHYLIRHSFFVVAFFLQLEKVLHLSWPTEYIENIEYMEYIEL